METRLHWSRCTNKLHLQQINVQVSRGEMWLTKLTCSHKVWSRQHISMHTGLWWSGMSVDWLRLYIALYPSYLYTNKTHCTTDWRLDTIVYVVWLATCPPLCKDSLPSISISSSSGTVPITRLLSRNTSSCLKQTKRWQTRVYSLQTIQEHLYYTVFHLI